LVSSLERLRKKRTRGWAMNVDKERKREGVTDEGKEMKSPVFFSVWISWVEEEKEGEEMGRYDKPWSCAHHVTS